MIASWFDALADNRVRCTLCPHACLIAEGGRGRCGVRDNRDGRLHALTYGRVTSAAMDPIEKKPLYHFLPGGQILSLGSWGCNLSCEFCQNHAISQQEAATEALAPERAVELARARGSVGIAYTYNEPLIAWEYVHACCRHARAAGLANVLVTNGFINPKPLRELLPLVDAMNIDIKAMDEAFYTGLCRGSLAPVLRTIETVVHTRGVHLELTTLIIPGYNDDPRAWEREAEWVAATCGPCTPVHLSAYFPRYQLQAPPTAPRTLEYAHAVFCRHLRHVYLGNVDLPRGADTRCHACGALLATRRGYHTRLRGLDPTGGCAACGADNDFVVASARRRSPTGKNKGERACI